MEQFILKEEMLKAEAPMIGKDYTGLGWVGPAIIQFGTEEQKEKYLPDILDGKSAWCTGYSEPDIGSDLAGSSVQGRARWRRVRRQRAEDLDLARPHRHGHLLHGAHGLRMREVRRHHLLADSAGLPGIEVRPIKSFAGDHFADLYNEVFFNDVRVPVENRVGKEGEGWQIICSALQNERSGIAEVNRHHKALERLIELAGRSRSRASPPSKMPSCGETSPASLPESKRLASTGCEP